MRAPGKLGAAGWWTAQSKLGTKGRVGQPERVVSFSKAPLQPILGIASEPPLTLLRR